MRGTFRLRPPVLCAPAIGLCRGAERRWDQVPQASSSRTLIDYKESYKQISCVEHLLHTYLYILKRHIFCKRHIFILQKSTMKLTAARLNYLHLTLQRFNIKSVMTSIQWTGFDNRIFVNTIHYTSFRI